MRNIRGKTNSKMGREWRSGERSALGGRGRDENEEIGREWVVQVVTLASSCKVCRWGRGWLAGKVGRGLEVNSTN